MGFAADQLARLRPLWDRMLDHRFLRQTRDGTIPDAVFATWMRQDYLFVEAAVPFLGALLARAPRVDRETLVGALGAMLRELDLFRERARAAGVDLEGVEPAFVAHAYVQFLMATAHGASYAEAWTVFYAAERAYHDSWRVVAAGIDHASPWLPFVENWAGAPFAAYVAALEARLDALALAAGPDERRRMAGLFETTTRYEIAFWEMASTGASWPGLPAGEG
jgi:thiaminase/transcriptional activator TenA